MVLSRPAAAGLVLICALSACAPPPPTLNGAEPASGPSGGGTEFILSGTGFEVGTVVEIGGAQAEVLSMSPNGNQLTVRTPGGTPGERAVLARIEDGDPSEPLVFTYEALQVTATEPAEGETVSSDTAVSVTFDQPIQEGAAIHIEGVAGESSWDGGMTLRFAPEQPFAAGSSQTATLSGVEDLAGNALEHSLSFEIEERAVARATGGSGGSRSTRRGGQKLDDERLETAWFGASELAFVEAKNIDYLWVRDGFSIDGHTFRVVRWEGPHFLGPIGAKRDTQDHQLAKAMTPEVHRALADSLKRNWAGKAKVSTSRGDVVVSGRIVDCSTGNLAAKVIVGFGAGAGRTTFDIRFTDAHTGQLLAAIHSRVVSGTVWSTTDSKFVKWMDKFARSVNDKGFATLYRKGSRRKK